MSFRYHTNAELLFFMRNYNIQNIYEIIRDHHLQPSEASSTYYSVGVFCFHSKNFILQKKNENKNKFLINPVVFTIYANQTAQTDKLW